MQQIINISFRNLVRQKRRNILLGVAIAFGALVLVLANAFSHGISKVLFEQIVKYTNGHVAISYIRNGNLMNQIFHDDVLIRDAIKKVSPADARVEEAVGFFGRAIGNGIADNVILVGVDMDSKLTEKEMKEFQANFKILDGSIEGLKDSAVVGYPVVLAKQKADYLKLKIGDVMRVRFTGVRNQTTSVQLTVVGIFKPSNVFMSSPIFLNIRHVRALAGYGPHDVATLQVNMGKPQLYAKKVANDIHAQLKPGLALMQGKGECANFTTDMLTLGFRTDSASISVLRKNLQLSSGDSASAFVYNGVILSHSLALQSNWKKGDTIRFSWSGKYDTAGNYARFVVSAVADSASPLPQKSLLVNERDFYRAYYNPLPSIPEASWNQNIPDTLNPLYKALAPQYLLMKRCATTDEYTKIYKEMGRSKYKGIMVSVQSMYETASAILNVEFAINLITIAAGLILFCIILIGVVNTLRMTIRERTREIGTMRAIGMQKKDVLSMFLLETGFLALFASVIGSIMAFAVMYGLSSITIDAGDNPMGMLLVEGHLYFAPTLEATISYVLLIIGITVFTAFFPSRRAAAMIVSDALRHVE
ncbi:MAG TPA: FtsX-like permease family protein [Chitinispirillaceae bacterium]|nr:FtsX-like permease family protein [Chitinispirillaceae bacterium]